MTSRSGDLGILVVGAGVVGLTASLALHNLGYRVAQIAPRAEAPDRRTSALLRGSVELLQRLGVWSDVRAAAAPLRSIRIIDGTKRLIRAPEVVFDAPEIGLDALGYNLPNHMLTAAIERQLSAAKVERIEAFVEGSATSEKGINVRVATGGSYDARLAIAADGRRSRMRDAAGIAVEAWRYEQSALVCNLRHTLPHHDTSTEFHTEHGPFTLVPLAHNRSSLVWVDQPAATAHRFELADRALAAEIEERSGAILGAITVEGERQSFPLGAMLAEELVSGRLILAGEAAHVFPPIGAQGLNLGLRDIAVLQEVLAGKPADPGAPDILADYGRRRRPDVVARTAAVDALNRSLLSDFLPVQVMRGLGLFLVDRLPPLRRLAMRQGMGVYEPLSETDR